MSRARTGGKSLPVGGIAGGEELYQAELLYRQAASLAKVGHWIWDEIAGRYTACSDELARIFGLPPDNFEEWFSSGNPLKNVHPEDVERYSAELDAATAERRSYSVDFRETMANGELRYLRESGQPVFDEAGRWVRTVGVIQALDFGGRELVSEFE